MTKKLDINYATNQGWDSRISTQEQPDYDQEEGDHEGDDYDGPYTN